MVVLNDLLVEAARYRGLFQAALDLLIDSCITRLKAQGPSRTCKESKEEEEEGSRSAPVPRSGRIRPARVRCVFTNSHFGKRHNLSRYLNHTANLVV